MTNRKNPLIVLAALLACALPFGASAQSPISEDFTGTTTTNSWYFFLGACLTAGTQQGVQPTGTTGGQIPGCTAIGTSYYGENLVGGFNGVAGSGQTLPDPVGNGALRFTNGYPGGYGQHGAIVSTAPFPTGQGIAVTFKTVTYRGDSGGAGGDGADGISFYLMDASQPAGIGSWGGSLAYSCSNSNPPYNGLVGGYIGLGIDEFGNFLNGAQLMPGYTGTNQATGDNSALGYGYKPDRIGLRGAGNIAWSWLNTNYPTIYPSSFTSAQQQAAVQATCYNGVEWNILTNSAVTTTGGATVPLYDYAPIPNAYVELPSTTQIANEAAMNRGAAVPIFYDLKITQDGLLSLYYSIAGGAYQPVITRQSITTSNGPLPANFLFGFAGSTGGDTNIHEILCFKAASATAAASSAGASEKQTATLETGAQVYFAYYDPELWTGRVTASTLSVVNGIVTIAATPNWDAACVLTGVAATAACATTGVAGPTAPEAPTSRVILSYNGTTGIPFEFANLSSAQQSTIDAGDVTPYNSNRTKYLRGDTSNEVNTSGVGLFRSRVNILADIIDSSPSWVGAPVDPYPAVWADRLYSSATMSEDGSSAQTYPTYVTADQARLNVVYVGANDGLMHGFRSGSYDLANNAFDSTNNDGLEVLAYMPAAVVQTIHSTTPTMDYSNTQYGHNFYVDATPGTGDVFYNNAWHTWLVSGLGAGGSAIFALDVSNPTTTAFTESNAANLVIGEWNSGTISCVNVALCGKNMGNTYGTPVLRRLHNGSWAVIFGNGFGSTSGDAGIYIMLINGGTGAASGFYYLSTATGSAATPNGIAFASAVDLDGDHITDYVYAGDLLGNVWRFDLTSNNPSNWAVTPGPVFKTPAGQPITTAIVVASGAPAAGMQQQLMLLFGTGQKTPLTSTSPATYAAGTQSLYGVWDWNMTNWNTLEPAATYAALTAANTGIGGANSTMTIANLQQQTVTVNAATLDRDIASNATVCWAVLSTCASGKQFGWYLNLPGVQEQIVFNPELVQQALTVNSLVPAPNSPTSCASVSDTGFTYVLSAMTGGAFVEVFLPPVEATNSQFNTNPQLTDTTAIGMQTNATGTSFITSNGSGQQFLVFETNQTQTGTGANGNNLQGGTVGPNLPPNTTGRRTSWIERR